MKKVSVKFLFLFLGVILFVACGKKEDINQRTVNGVMGIHADDPYLKMLVSYIDTQTYPNKRLARLKLVDSLSAGEKFLGRAYSINTPGVNGFGIPLYEYYVPYDPYQSSDQGFKYLMARACSPGFNCPVIASVKSKDPVAYVAPPNLIVTEGIIPVYQYSTPGGFTAGGSGNVSFTSFIEEPQALQRIGIPVTGLTVIGSVYHGTKSDCAQNPPRSIWCNATY